MKLDSLVMFFKHISNREASHGIAHAFRFKAVLSSRKKGILHPARYEDDGHSSGDNDEVVNHLPPRRKRQQVDLDQTVLNSQSKIARPTSSVPRGRGPPMARDITGLYTSEESPAPV